MDEEAISDQTIHRLACNIPECRVYQFGLLYLGLSDQQMDQAYSCSVPTCEVVSRALHAWCALKQKQGCNTVASLIKVFRNAERDGAVTMTARPLVDEIRQSDKINSTKLFALANTVIRDKLEYFIIALLGFDTQQCSEWSGGAGKRMHERAIRYLECWRELHRDDANHSERPTSERLSTIVNEAIQHEVLTEDAKIAILESWVPLPLVPYSHTAHRTETYTSDTVDSVSQYNGTQYIVSYTDCTGGPINPERSSTIFIAITKKTVAHTASSGWQSGKTLPDWFDPDYTTCVLVDGDSTLVLVGGKGKQAGTSACLIGYPYHNIALLPMLPVALGGTAVCANKQWIYIFGGVQYKTDESSQTCSQVYRLNMAQRSKWEQLPDMMHPVAYGIPVTCRRIIYLIGGLTDEGMVDFVQSYRTILKKWTSKKSSVASPCCAKNSGAILLSQTVLTVTPTVQHRHYACAWINRRVTEHVMQVEAIRPLMLDGVLLFVFSDGAGNVLLSRENGSDLEHAVNFSHVINCRSLFIAKLSSW